MLIEGLPAGSVFSFAWNFLISVSFQFVGFMLTYILHTSHAAKYGSRAGLGVTLIQYGLLYRARRSDIFRHDSDEEVGSTVVGGQATSLAQRGLHALSPKYWTMASDEQDDSSVVVSDSAVHDLISFCLMTIGMPFPQTHQQYSFIADMWNLEFSPRLDSTLVLRVWLRPRQAMGTEYAHADASTCIQCGRSAAGRGDTRPFARCVWG